MQKSDLDLHINYICTTKQSNIQKMELAALSAIAIIGIIIFIWLLPILSIVLSRKTTGAEKLGWILAVIFISWFAWIIYLIVAPIKKKNN